MISVVRTGGGGATPFFPRIGPVGPITERVCCRRNWSEATGGWLQLDQLRSGRRAPLPSPAPSDMCALQGRDCLPYGEERHVSYWAHRRRRRRGSRPPAEHEFCARLIRHQSNSVMPSRFSCGAPLVPVDFLVTTPQRAQLAFGRCRHRDRTEGFQ